MRPSGELTVKEPVSGWRFFRLFPTFTKRNARLLLLSRS